jgi:hypothetical protein
MVDYLLGLALYLVVSTLPWAPYGLLCKLILPGYGLLNGNYYIWTN